MMGRFVKIFFIAYVLIFVSCGISKTGINTNEQLQENTEVVPMILQLNFEITKNDSIQLIEAVANRGKLRRDDQPLGALIEGDLVLSFFDSDKNLCHKLTVSNPLSKKAEFSDDYKTIQMKEIKLDKTSFFVRTQYKECMKSIVIEKASTQPNKSLVKLIELPLIIKRDESVL